MAERIAGLVVGGERAEGGSGKDFDVVNPATGQAVATLALADASDVDRAVAAAAAALPEWGGAPPVERSGALNRLAAILEARAEEYAQVETSQTGKPIKLCREFDVPGSIDNVSYFAGAARHLQGSAAAEWDGAHTSMIRREPVGVVGSIAPWNYPLQMAMWKILPAIAAGNTIVLKPSELTPLTALMLAEDCLAAGIPAGVVNVVTGSGPEAGEPLITHPLVRMVSFTGSTGVGKRVGALAVDGVRRVHLELGGKAPFVVFDDADLEAAVHGAVAASLINTGQDCTAATRAYVQRPLYDAFVQGVADLMATVRLGDPLDPHTDQGPLISWRQQERVAGFVDRALADGARALAGGRIPAGALERGAYYEPTLVVDAAQTSEIVQEEVFGPVLVILPHDGDDDAVRVANNSIYGLSGSVHASDPDRALAVARRVRSGTLSVNGGIYNTPDAPFGGYKQSGFGREMGVAGLEEFLQMKTLAMPAPAQS